MVKCNEMCSDPKCTLGVHSEKGGLTGAQCEHSIKLTNPPGRGCSRSDGPSRTRPAADPTPSTNTRFRCDERAAHSWRSATAPLLVRSASSSSTRRASAASGAPRNQGYGAAAVLGVPYRAPPSSLPGAVGDAAPTPAPSGTTAVGRGGGGGGVGVGQIQRNVLGSQMHTGCSQRKGRVDRSPMRAQHQANQPTWAWLFSV